MRLIICFFICLELLVLNDPLFAQSIDEAQAKYLRGEYSQAVEDLEKILSMHKDEKSPARLYYYLGLSYLKEGNYIRASDCFDIILKEYQDCEFREPAEIKLIDIDILNSDYTLALNRCENFLAKFPASDFKGRVLFRQYKAYLKSGNLELANQALSKLKTSYPAAVELSAIEEKPAAQEYFSVQVGSFKDRLNAENLKNLLKQKGYESYILEGKDEQDNLILRVRVGKFGLIQEAKELEKRLSEQGMPTKICQ